MRIRETMAVLRESRLPTRWMRLYVFAYFISIFVHTALQIVTVVYALARRTDTAEIRIQLLLLLVLLGSSIMAFLYMKALNPKGYVWNLIHMGCTAVYYAGVSALAMMPQYDTLGFGYPGWFLIALVLYGGGWFLPNYLYFRKRRGLLRAYAEEEISYALERWHSLEQVRPDGARVRNAGIKAILKASGRNVAWFRIYVLILMPITAAFVGLSLPSRMFLPVDLYAQVYTGNIASAAVGIASAVCGVTCLIACVRLRELSRAGYGWNLAYLGGFVVYYLSFTVEYALRPRHASWVYLGVLFLILMIWPILNIIYFTKRKTLFRPYTEDEVLRALQSDPPAQPAPPMRPVHHGRPTKANLDGTRLKVRARETRG